MKLTEQISRIKKVMGLTETIAPSEAYTDMSSLMTLINKKRNICTISLQHNDYQKYIKIINTDPSLNSIHIKKNPYKLYIIYREGNEKNAHELERIFDKYNGYLPPSATPEDTKRIGELLEYNPEDVQTFINQIYKKNGEN